MTLFMKKRRTIKRISQKPFSGTLQLFKKPEIRNINGNLFLSRDGVFDDIVRLQLNALQVSPVSEALRIQLLNRFGPGRSHSKPAVFRDGFIPPKVRWFPLAAVCTA